MSLEKLRRRSISLLADASHQGGKQSAWIWPAMRDHSSPISPRKEVLRDWADPCLGTSKACKIMNLNVIVKDCRTVKPEDFGTFWCISLHGGLEAFFCSIENGKLKTRAGVTFAMFFQPIADLFLSVEGSYMQTMVFAKQWIDFKDIDGQCRKGSAAPCECFWWSKEISWFMASYAQEMVIRNSERSF